jgi:hypothetical protein
VFRLRPGIRGGTEHGGTHVPTLGGHRTRPLQLVEDDLCRAVLAGTDVRASQREFRVRVARQGPRDTSALDDRVVPTTRDLQGVSEERSQSRIARGDAQGDAQGLDALVVRAQFGLPSTATGLTFGLSRCHHTTLAPHPRFETAKDAVSAISLDIDAQIAVEKEPQSPISMGISEMGPGWTPPVCSARGTPG